MNWDDHPEDHADWKPGQMIVNIRGVGHEPVVVASRKRSTIGRPGWWVNDTNGQSSGGIADIATDWRSVDFLLYLLNEPQRTETP